MEQKKYLPLYYAWMRNELLPHREGLCNEFGTFNDKECKWDFSGNPLFLLMSPEPYKTGRTQFWAGSGSDDEWRFNELRQNIVLLMAAMNDEL